MINLIGIPFKQGGNNIDGFDCYGLVVYVFKNFYGIEIPNYNHQIIDAFNATDINTTIDKALKNWQEIKEPEEPCAVLIRNHPVYVNHIGVYVGGNKFMHALKKVGVILSDINDKYWSKKIEGYYKWIK